MTAYRVCENRLLLVSRGVGHGPCLPEPIRFQTNARVKSNLGLAYRVGIVFKAFWNWLGGRTVLGSLGVTRLAAPLWRNR